MLAEVLAEAVFLAGRQESLANSPASLDALGEYGRAAPCAADREGLVFGGESECRAARPRAVGAGGDAGQQRPDGAHE